MIIILRLNRFENYFFKIIKRGGGKFRNFEEIFLRPKNSYFQFKKINIVQIKFKRDKMMTRSNGLHISGDCCRQTRLLTELNNQSVTHRHRSQVSVAFRNRYKIIIRLPSSHHFRTKLVKESFFVH